MSQDTPKKPRSTSESGYAHGGLKGGRDAILQDLGSIPQVNIVSDLLDAFLSKTGTLRKETEPKPNPLSTIPQPEQFDFVPKVFRQIIADVLSKLKAEHRIEGERWSEFQTNPRDIKKEGVTFGKLKTIINSIIEASPYATSNLLEFKVEGSIAPVSDRRVDTSLPDAYMVLKESSIPEAESTADAKRRYRRDDKQNQGNKDNWDDIPVIFEVKREDDKTGKKLYDDFRQPLWEMHHTMRNDARRRFVHGVTIEDTSMRFWYHDHSVVTVSPPFDWITDHSTFIQLILGLAASTREELGYDESIRRVVKPPNFQGTGPAYEIDVHNGAETGTFVTIRLISDVGTDAICGRGTRVWLVVNKDHPNGPEYVLKDCWIDADCHCEGTMLELIHNIALSPPGGRQEEANIRKKFPGLMRCLRKGDFGRTCEHP